MQDAKKKDWARAGQGTVFGYVEPGRAFREAGERISTLDCYAIVYVDPHGGNRWIFPVPREHEDNADAVLLANHPDFALEMDGKNRIIHTKPDIVTGFPDMEDWYKGDQKYGMPYGEETCFSSIRARFIWRAERMVSAAAYDPIEFRFTDGRPSVMCGRGIYLNRPPSSRRGAAVEAP
jgi:hypothetical protein